MRQQPKPNIVIIMADQLRADLITPHITPNIHNLSQESVRFNRAYCTSPLCVPARGSFFTGKYPNETGCLINPWEESDAVHGYVQQDTPNLYRLLEKEWDGWHTGKQHLLTEDRLDQAEGSQIHWLPLEGRYAKYLKAAGKRAPGGAAFQGIVPEMAGGTTTRAVKYSIPATGCYEEGFEHFFDGFILNDTLDALQRRDQTKPLFLSAMFLAPHPPLEIPEPWYSMFKKEDIPLPLNVGEWASGQSPLQLYNLTGAVGSRYTREDWHRIWTVYAGLVRLLDDCVGRIVDELKAQGIYDDTLLIFTSDHGEMLGSHSLWQKMCMYEESVRTPLFFKFPAASQLESRDVDALVSAVDLVPTICEYAEISVPDGVAGVSLLPLIEGKQNSRDRIFIQFDGNGARGNFQRCVIEGNHKLIVDMFKDEIYLELYDLSRDPQERDNLAFLPEQQDRVLNLLSYLRQHMKVTGDLLELPWDVYEGFRKQYDKYHP